MYKSNLNVRVWRLYDDGRKQAITMTKVLLGFKLDHCILGTVLYLWI